MLVNPKSQKNPEDSTISSDKAPTNKISISHAQNLLSHLAKYIVSILSPISINYFIFNTFLFQRCYPNIPHLYILLTELQSSHTPSILLCIKSFDPPPNPSDHATSPTSGIHRVSLPKSHQTPDLSPEPAHRVFASSLAAPMSASK